MLVQGGQSPEKFTNVLIWFKGLDHYLSKMSEDENVLNTMGDTHKEGSDLGLFAKLTPSLNSS